LPVPHFASEKSSVNEVGRFALVLVLVLVLAFAFALRLGVREFEYTRLVFVLVFEPRLANAMIIIIAPSPTMPTAMTPPSIHQIALDFFRGGGSGCGTDGSG